MSRPEATTPVIGLLTDYGRRDPYVGELHLAVHRIAPAVRVVDLTHDIAPQSVAPAAWWISRLIPHLPAGLIGVGVVDPGVGTAREIIAVELTNGQRWIGPDNGLFAALRSDAGPLWPPGTDRPGIARAVVVSDPRWFGPADSKTFHGRDRMAPVAAHLAAGVALSDIGPPLDREPHACEGLLPTADPDGAMLGQVIHVDHFGNLLTNLPAASAPSSRLVAELGEHRILGPAATFADVPIGAPLLYTGSHGSWEIAVRDGSASDTLRIQAGTPVRIAAEPSGS